MVKAVISGSFSVKAPCLRTFFNMKNFINRRVYNDCRGIPIKPISFRISEELEQKVTELFAFFGASGDSDSDKFRDLLGKLYEKLILYKKSQTVGEPIGDSEPDMDAIDCNLRVLVNKDWYCVNRPPKAVKLLSLKFCEVCKVLRYNIPEKAKLPAQPAQPKNLCERESERELEPTPEQKAESQKALTDPSKPFDKYGMLYCHTDGFWVYPSKCKTCHNYSCPRKVSPQTI